MYEQLYLAGPFGLERLRAETHYHEGWGWAWAVTAWDGHRWATVDSGYGRSDRRAIQACAQVLELLARYENSAEAFEEPF